jgi:hypothetical protein
LHSKNHKTEEDENEKNRCTRGNRGAGDRLAQKVQIPDLVQEHEG